MDAWNYMSVKLPKKGLTKTYNPMDYPKYTDYDYINVDRICDIPVDYYEPMGVPIAFIDWYDETEWEILDLIKPKLLKDGIHVRTSPRLIVRRRTIAESIQEKQKTVHQRWLKEECEQMEKERDYFITRCLDNTNGTEKKEN